MTLRILQVNEQEDCGKYLTDKATGRIDKEYASVKSAFCLQHVLEMCQKIFSWIIYNYMKLLSRTG
jgi:hypothetical protein